MSSKTFLLQECENVKDLLDATLRHDYGIDGSRHFYDECSARLSYLTSEIQQTAAANASMLATLGRFLSELAALICRIERSSLGEYSWPFVEELKELASAICRESTLADKNAPPKVYVFAEGGLASYAIYTERRRPSASQRRLLTIVFPKSLKHFVLLHTILGHELGHAIWQVSKHQHTLAQEVIVHLLRAGGSFENPDATAAWLYSPNAPQNVRDYLSKLSAIDQTTVFHRLDWGAWVEEVLCDLIGLVTFGPGFVAALCQLLYTVDPSGVELGDEHPPVAWRVNMVLAGAKILKYDQLPPESGPLRDAMQRFWDYLEGFRKTDPWFDVMPIGQLADAIEGVRKLLSAHVPSLYPVPRSGRIGGLLKKVIELTPPIGHKVTADGLPKSVHIDFRHIIYAGWIATQHTSNIPFKRINQLCEHAIMQQRAIRMAQQAGNK